MTNGEQRQKITRYVLGLTATALALYFLLTHRREPIIFFASLFFLIVCLTDTLQSKIPNIANLSLLIVGLWYNIQTGGLLGGTLSLAGLLTGLGLLIVPYLLGGMGAGDVKALAALGALLGPRAILQVFALGGLIGGGMALLHLAMSDHPLQILGSWRVAIRQMIYRCRPIMPEKDPAAPKMKYSYGPAIAFGFFAFICWGGLK